MSSGGRVAAGDAKADPSPKPREELEEACGKRVVESVIQCILGASRYGMSGWGLQRRCEGANHNPAFQKYAVTIAHALPRTGSLIPIHTSWFSAVGTSGASSMSAGGKGAAGAAAGNQYPVGRAERGER